MPAAIVTRMTGAGRGGVRVLRALTFVLASLSLTVAAHVAGGGRWAPAGVVVTAAMLWPVALLGSASQRRLVHLGPALVLAQVGGHLALGTVHGSVPAASLSLSCVTHATHARHALAGCPTGAEGMQMAGLTGAAGGMLAPSGWMVAAHVVATVLTALVLARGEQVLWQVLDLVLRPLPELLPRVAAATTSARSAPLALVTGSITVRCARGPPAATA